MEDFLEESGEIAGEQISWEEYPEARDAGFPACSEPGWGVHLPPTLTPTRLPIAPLLDLMTPFPASPSPGVTSAPGGQEAHLLLISGHHHHKVIKKCWLAGREGSRVSWD